MEKGKRDFGKPGGGGSSGPLTPTAGINGFIQFVSTSKDFQQLAFLSQGPEKEESESSEEEPQPEWSGGEVILGLEEGIDEASALKEIQKEFSQMDGEKGEVLRPRGKGRQGKPSFPYLLVRSKPLRENWRKHKRSEWEAKNGRGQEDSTIIQGLKEVRLGTRTFLERFSKRSQRRFFSKAVPNYIRTGIPINTTAVTEVNPKQWSLTAEGLQEIWEQYGKGKPDLRIAVLDSGIRKNHPNLSENLLWEKGYDFVNDDMDVDNEPGPDSNPDEPSSAGSDFHGTHVAGIIAARPSPDQKLNLHGVAGDVKIIPIRVLGERGSGTDFDVVQGILFAAGLLEVDGKFLEPPADIINLSLGGPGESPILREAIQKATEAGVVVVVAAGNDGSMVPNYPASLPQVISVGAYMENGKYAEYSNYGVNVDVMAPGDNILSSWVKSLFSGDVATLEYMSGTSMASPFMAGVVALMKGVNSNLRLPEIRQVLFENGGEIEEGICLEGQTNHCGHGKLNLENVMKTSKELDETQKPKIKLAKDWISATPENPQMTLSLKNSGTGELKILEEVKILHSQVRQWLSVRNEGNQIQFSFDPVQLKNRSVAAEVEIVTNAREISVGAENSTPIVFRNGILKITAVYGPQDLKVVLLEASQKEPQVKAYSKATLTNGLWRYHMDPPSPGNYVIYAGRDEDNDGYICGWDDSCGTYGQGIGSPTPLKFDGSQSMDNLNFEVRMNHLVDFKIPYPKD